MDTGNTTTPSTTAGGMQLGRDAPGLVRRVRRIKDLSQRDLAAELGVPQSTIARIESGRQMPRAGLFLRILDLAGITMYIHDSDGRLLGALRPPPADKAGSTRTGR